MGCSMGCSDQLHAETEEQAEGLKAPVSITPVLSRENAAIPSSEDLYGEGEALKGGEDRPFIPQSELNDIYDGYAFKVVRLANKAPVKSSSLNDKLYMIQHLARCAALHHRVNQERLSGILKNGCLTGAKIGAAVNTGALSEMIKTFLMNSPSKDSSLSAFLAVAESEVLFHAGLSTGLSGKPLVHLTSFRESSLSRMLPLDCDQKSLLELIQLAMRSGYEEAMFGRPMSPSSYDLLRHVGVYAESLTVYLHSMLALLEEESGVEVKSWFPKGKEFKEIARQRNRWGQSPFVYDSSTEVSQEVLHALSEYYVERYGLIESEANLRRSALIRKIFPTATVA